MKRVLNKNGIENFLGIVTDDGANIKRAREMVCSEYDWLVEYGCICHAPNLLVEDLLKINSIELFRNQAIEIVKQTKNSHILHATFERIQKSKKDKVLSLKMPIKTRWNSFSYCLESLLETKSSLQCLAIDESVQEILKPVVKKLLLDENVFWKRAEIMFNLISPVAKWVTKFERNSGGISYVVECFDEIKNLFSNNISKLPITKAEEPKLTDKVKLRIKKTLKPIHFVANLLEPSLKGAKLN